MVCEFLPVKYKKMLLDIATTEDLRKAGYSKAGAYKAKEWGVISDEKCEKLIDVLGNRARPILFEALREFALQLRCFVSC